MQEQAISHPTETERVCPVCGGRVLITTARQGGKRYCSDACGRQARKASARAYRQRNPEKVRASSRAWELRNAEKRRIQNRVHSRLWARRDRQRNPEKYRANSRSYRQQNPEKVRARNRRRYHRNPEMIIAANYAWVQRNRQKVQARKHDWVQRNPSKDVISKVRSELRKQWSAEPLTEVVEALALVRLANRKLKEIACQQ